MKAALILGTVITGLGLLIGEIHLDDSLRIICVYLLSYSVVAVVTG